MRICEIKATPYPYTVKYNSSHNWGPTLEAVFTTREGDTVSARLTYNESEDAIGFGFKRNNRSEITHGGDQFRILMTVVDFVQNHLSKMLTKHTPTVFYFSADVSEPSRVKLYRNRAAPIISRILGSEWTGPETKSFTDSAGFTDMNYIWRKSVNPVQETIAHEPNQLVLIRGNIEYARAKNQHKQLEKFYNQVVAVMKKHGTVQVIDSDITSDQIPDADKYVGHSRGCGYEHALDSDIYFCLDEYERVPADHSKGITASTPIKDRPPLHPGHLCLNPMMKRKLIKFLKK